MKTKTSFKDDAEKMNREELLEDIIRCASEHIFEYGPSGFIEPEKIIEYITKRLECPICGKLDQNNHDDLAHRVNADYTGA